MKFNGNDRHFMPKIQLEIEIVTSSVIKLKENRKNDMIIRNRALLFAHMQRKHHLLSKELQANLDDLLRNSVLQLDTMLGYSISNGWLATVNTVLDMRRCLVQAIDLAENDLVQIPHFSP